MTFSPFREPRTHHIFIYQWLTRPCHSKNTKATEFALRGLVYRQALEIENPVPQANNCQPGSSGRMVSGQRSKNLNNTPLGNCTGDLIKAFAQRKSRGAEPGISSKYRFTSIVMPKRNCCPSFAIARSGRHRQRAKFTAVGGLGSFREFQLKINLTFFEK